MNLKENFYDYTEQEFLAFVEEFFINKTGLKGAKREQYIDRLVEHFEKITEHPDGYGVIYYPQNEQEDSPAGVVKTVKDWRAANGKPGFKEA